MSKMTNKAIASIFRKVADKIENNTCEVDNDTLTEIANNLIHIKLNAEQLCRYLNVSRSTISRMVIDGRIPHPRKTLGGDKYWWQDEVDEYIARYKDKYGLLASIASLCCCKISDMINSLEFNHIALF